jgi:hypothetical protein
VILDRLAVLTEQAVDLLRFIDAAAGAVDRENDVRDAVALGVSQDARHALRLHLFSDRPNDRHFEVNAARVLEILGVAPASFGRRRVEEGVRNRAFLDVFDFRSRKVQRRPRVRHFRVKPNDSVLVVQKDAFETAAIFHRDDVGGRNSRDESEQSSGKSGAEARDVKHG